MAKQGAEDRDLLQACKAAVEGSKHKIVMAIRVFKSRGVWGKSSNLKLGRQMAEPRVLAICLKQKEKKSKAFLRVLKASSGNALEPAKLYKLRHLSKVEIATNDPSGRTFTLGFDNLRSHSTAVAPPQWTMRNIDDRNRFLISLLNVCKNVMGQIPKVVGIDVVEMALWAKENTQIVTDEATPQDGPTDAVVTETDMKVSVGKELVSQAEEEDMEALLDTYVLGIGEAEVFSERLKRELLALEAANVHAILETEPLVQEILKGLSTAESLVDDMDEWLGIFNVKLRHMREDIESVEIRNNNLEMQAVNNTALLEELDKLVARLSISSEYEACLTRGSFEEATMAKNVEAGHWLTSAYSRLEAPDLDPAYLSMRAVREKKAELDKLRNLYVGRASDFLKSYFAGIVDSVINDKGYFSQRGQLKRPNHADLRAKCRKYARLVQHLKSLDTGCLISLRKAYCGSFNLLLRREAREFSNELRASTRVVKNPTIWLEASAASTNTPDTSELSVSFVSLLTLFVPFLVDESSFFASFMCFDISSASADNDKKEDDLDTKENELAALNESLRDLLDGIQEDFIATVDWAYKLDPLRCITMHGDTVDYISSQKAEAAGFVRILLSDVESRISSQFGRFIDEVCHQIEKNERNAKPVGILPFIPRFAGLATRMEQYIAGHSRDLVDLGYTKIVSAMFTSMEKIGQNAEHKVGDVFLLENYAAFQNSLYELANAVPTLAKFYQQASESYEQSCTRHVNMIIYYQFEKLFQFARKVEDLMYTMTPEEIPYQVGVSKMDLRKVLKVSLSGVDKSVAAMYKKLQKSMTTEELLPSLWEKCKKEFLTKYESFVELVGKVYPSENVPAVTEMKELLASM